MIPLWNSQRPTSCLLYTSIEKARISTNAMAKMGKGGDVSTNVLRKICLTLNCELDDIVEIEHNDAEQ